MSGNTPCAVAIVSKNQSPENPIDAGGTVLESIIRSNEERCQGAATAIVCHNIYNSMKGQARPTWEPARLVPTNDATRRYFETYGCTGDKTRTPGMICHDRYPPQCAKHIGDKLVEGDLFFDDQIWEGASEKTLPDLTSIYGLTLAGLLSGVGMIVVLFRVRHGGRTAGTESLLAASNICRDRSDEHS